MRYLMITTIVFAACAFSTSFDVTAHVDEKTALEFIDIRIEPVREGRNVMHARVRNPSTQDQILDTWIQTNSAWGGWGQNFIDVVPAGRTMWIRKAYGVSHPLTDTTRFRFFFYDRGPAATSATGTSVPKPAGTQRDCIKQVDCRGSDLERQKASVGKRKAVSKRQGRLITKIFRQFQSDIKDDKYEAVWNVLSQDFRDAQLRNNFDALAKAMKRPYTGLPLSKSEILDLKPKSVSRQNGFHVVTAALKDEQWRVSFLKVEGQWKIDSIDRVDAGPRLAMADSKMQEEAVLSAFKRWQNAAKDGKYEAAWKLCSNNFRRDTQTQNDYERFKKIASSDMFEEVFLRLQLESVDVVRLNELSVLNATHGGQPWVIRYIAEDGQWKIFNIRRLERGRNWKDRLTSTLPKRSTKHFDIFYYKDSTAEREIEQIVSQREKGMQEICEFLGREPDTRICMFFFEDGGTKYSETGHQGAGWATGDTLVEIYNPKQKLDPYHEMVHILSRPYGYPPALFVEGLAVYLSETLGARALASLKGGTSTIFDRVRALEARNELIPLEELLTYREIGSSKTNPPVAYPEAASFVKFLVEAYGKDKFLIAYRALENSGSDTQHEKNVRTLEKIYGKPLPELKSAWRRAVKQSK